MEKVHDFNRTASALIADGRLVEAKELLEDAIREMPPRLDSDATSGI